MGAAEIERFLTHLAVAGNVAASTQNQALCSFVIPTKHKFTGEINKKTGLGKIYISSCQYDEKQF